MDKKTMQDKIEEAIENTAVIRHYLMEIWLSLSSDEAAKAADAAKKRATDLINDLFWLYRVLCSQNSKDTKGESHDSRES